MPAPQPPNRKPTGPAQHQVPAMPPGAPKPPAAKVAPAATPGPGAGAKAWERAKPILDAAFRLYKLDRDAMGEMVQNPPSMQVTAIILALGAVGFAVGFHRWNMLLLRPLSIVVWVAVTHAMALRAGGKGEFSPLLRAFSILTVVDILAVIGPLGQVVVVIGTLYAAFILTGLVEEHYGVGGTTQFKCVVVGFAATFALVVMFSLVDAAIRGQSRWGS